MADGDSNPVQSDDDAVRARREYHRMKSREWYERTKALSPGIIKARNAYSAERRVAKKAAWVLKFGGCCAHCGGIFPDCVFDFHHINSSEKDADPSKLFVRSDEVIARELSRCMMLCANCHRVEHDRLKYKDHAKRKISKPVVEKTFAVGWRYQVDGRQFDSQADAARSMGISPARFSQLFNAPGCLWTRERCLKERKPQPPRTPRTR